MLQRILAFLIVALAAVPGNAMQLPTSPRAEAAIAATRPMLVSALAALPARPGTPLYIRIFKEEKLLEVWIAGDKGYRLFKSYPICAISGRLGPKVVQGDAQAPEGFYEVTADQLNPSSNFHLAMNIGYPNAFDRQNRRTGSAIMIHGACVSIGCFAMTNGGIDEIYTLVHASLASGADAVPVHVFPFRMTIANLAWRVQDRWFGFWQELKPAYDAFETTRQVPIVGVYGGHYIVGPWSAGGLTDFVTGGVP